jgi:dolichol-phosphate mannosyltransferase
LNAQNEWASIVFQGPKRFTGSFDFDLIDLIGSAFVLLTPTVALAIAAIAISKKFLTGLEDMSGNTRNIRSYRLLMTLTFFPFAVFLFFSLFRNTKLNWTGPLWLGTLPHLAYFLTHVLPRQPGKLLIWTKRPLKSTIVIVLLIYGAALHYLVLGLAGLPYPKNLFGLGWPAIAGQIESLVGAHEQKTGERPLVVGMDTDRINSWLAFYRSQAMTEAKGAATNAGAFQTAGRHLFGRESGMYLFWFPKEDQDGKTMVLVGRKPEDLKGDHITSRARSTHDIKEVEAWKNGKIASRYYYRIIEGYHVN